VLLASGELIHAATVIANADMLQTVYKLVGEEYFPESYLTRLQRMEVSCSLFVVYLATDLNLAREIQHFIHIISFGLLPIIGLIKNCQSGKHH
jgi:prolycopene isomerase